ncbi:MAG: ABC transporter permease subunit [Planctomycetales bacterium]|nr:ABC transporter permease subunit [Planctomycetales bacterium]
MKFGLRTALAAVAAVTLAIWLFRGEPAPDVRVGSKSFTESKVLAELARLLAEHAGATAIAEDLGGTQVVWSALRSGEIDAYVDYTGTIHREIYADETLQDDDELRQRLQRDGVHATQFLGFSNSYRLGMKEQTAERLGIRTVADLAAHEELRYGMGNEFLERADGWPALRQAFGLKGEVVGLDHQLAYQALEAGDLDVVDIYSTDPAIAVHGLRVLEDDFFPRYDALLLYRAELEQTHPEVVAQWRRLEGAINESAMLKLNEAVEVHGEQEPLVAAAFARGALDVETDVKERTLWDRLNETTRGHLWLVLSSLTAAILVAVPLGVLAAKRPRLGQVIVTSAEIVQTIPGLALLVFLSAALQRLSLPSLREPPVIIALFLYSLLPVLRNTMAGIQGIPPRLIESAQALGLSSRDQLLQIELPLAAKTILAGIKTTAVINVGYATLGGLIGARCYGEPIMAGLRKNSPDLMLEGAVPAALMALLVKALFELAERRMRHG